MKQILEKEKARTLSPVIEMVQPKLYELYPDLERVDKINSIK